jgi:hypothetical protein
MRSWPLLLVLVGCMPGMGYSTLDQVTNAAREYNNDVRWGRYAQAARHVPATERQHFIEQHSALEDELDIADYEVAGIDVDKKGGTASLRIAYTWSLRARGIVEKTTTKQDWKRFGSDWVLEKEERERGAPLLFFAEPVRAQASK